MRSPIHPTRSSREAGAAGPAPRPAAAVRTSRRRPNRLVAAGVAALVAFVVYALTVEPTVPTGTRGELIAAAYVLGVAHPPGYPLYMLLGYLASHLPGGSPALLDEPPLRRSSTRSPSGSCS